MFVTFQCLVERKNGVQTNSWLMTHRLTDSNIPAPKRSPIYFKILTTLSVAQPTTSRSVCLSFFFLLFFVYIRASLLVCTASVMCEFALFGMRHWRLFSYFFVKSLKLSRMGRFVWYMNEYASLLFRFQCWIFSFSLLCCYNTIKSLVLKYTESFTSVF